MIEVNASIRKIDLDTCEGIIRINDIPNVGIHYCVFSEGTIDDAVEHFKTDKPIKLSGDFEGNDDRGYAFVINKITFV